MTFYYKNKTNYKKSGSNDIRIHLNKDDGCGKKIMCHKQNLKRNRAFQTNLLTNILMLLFSPP